MDTVDRLILFLFIGGLWLSSSVLFYTQTEKLVDALDKVTISYSSHNNIKCAEVDIFHSENYDVAEGTGIKEWIEKCKREGTLEEK
ncbi:MAG: hypothetical protein WCQ69_10650 [Bacteroidales bacterium]|jgi:hypothetical protein